MNEISSCIWNILEALCNVHVQYVCRSNIFTILAETSCLGLAAEISDLSLFEEYIIPNGHCQLGMSYHVFMAPVFFSYTNTAIVIFVVFVCGATK
jgi:hypothetical protein